MLKGLIRSIELWLITKNISRISNRTTTDMRSAIKSRQDILQIIMPDYKFNRDKLRTIRFNTYYSTLGDLCSDIRLIKVAITKDGYVDLKMASDEQYAIRISSFNSRASNPVTVAEMLDILNNSLETLSEAISNEGVSSSKEQYYLRMSSPILKTIDNILSFLVGAYE